MISICKFQRIKKNYIKNILKNIPEKREIEDKKKQSEGLVQLSNTNRVERETQTMIPLTTNDTIKIDSFSNPRSDIYLKSEQNVSNNKENSENNTSEEKDDDHVVPFIRIPFIPKKKYGSSIQNDYFTTNEKNNDFIPYDTTTNLVKSENNNHLINSPKKENKFNNLNIKKNYNIFCINKNTSNLSYYDSIDTKMLNMLTNGLEFDERIMEHKLKKFYHLNCQQEQISKYVMSFCKDSTQDQTSLASTLGYISQPILITPQFFNFTFDIDALIHVCDINDLYKHINSNIYLSLSNKKPSTKELMINFNNNTLNINTLKTKHIAYILCPSNIRISIYVCSSEEFNITSIESSYVFSIDKKNKIIFLSDIKSFCKTLNIPNDSFFLLEVYGTKNIFKDKLIDKLLEKIKQFVRINDEQSLLDFSFTVTTEENGSIVVPKNEFFESIGHYPNYFSFLNAYIPCCSIQRTKYHTNNNFLDEHQVFKINLHSNITDGLIKIIGRKFFPSITLLLLNRLTRKKKLPDSCDSFFLSLINKVESFKQSFGYRCEFRIFPGNINKLFTSLPLKAFHLFDYRNLKEKILNILSFNIKTDTIDTLPTLLFFETFIKSCLIKGDVHKFPYGSYFNINKVRQMFYNQSVNIKTFMSENKNTMEKNLLSFMLSLPNKKKKNLKRIIDYFNYKVTNKGIDHPIDFFLSALPKKSFKYKDIIKMIKVNTNYNLYALPFELKAQYINVLAPILKPLQCQRKKWSEYERLQLAYGIKNLNMNYTEVHSSLLFSFHLSRSLSAVKKKSYTLTLEKVDCPVFLSIDFRYEFLKSRANVDDDVWCVYVQLFTNELINFNLF